jgi:zinc transport system permease protein
VIESFLIKPFLALTLVTLSCSLLGVFVLWKRLAYFGDGLSHSILLGFTLGVIFDSNQISALIAFALFFAILVGLASKNPYFSKDTIIAISSYFCISLAIILNDVFNKDINLGTYVFGDILTVGNQEIWGLLAIFIITIFYVIFAFRKILLININSDLAKIDGIKIQFWNLSFLILLAITIALSVRIVGILLMTALLVLPAAIARIFALSAKQMLILSLIIGLFNAILSFKIADNYNLAVGSSVIATFCVIFIFSLFLKKITTR